MVERGCPAAHCRRFPAWCSGRVDNTRLRADAIVEQIIPALLGCSPPATSCNRQRAIHSAAGSSSGTRAQKSLLAQGHPDTRRPVQAVHVPITCRPWYVLHTEGPEHRGHMGDLKDRRERPPATRSCLALPRSWSFRSVALLLHLHRGCIHFQTMMPAEIAVRLCREFLEQSDNLAEERGSSMFIQRPGAQPSTADSSTPIEQLKGAWPLRTQWWSGAGASVRHCVDDLHRRTVLGGIIERLSVQVHNRTFTPAIPIPLKCLEEYWAGGERSDPGKTAIKMRRKPYMASAESDKGQGPTLSRHNNVDHQFRWRASTSSGCSTHIGLCACGRPKPCHQ